MRNHTHSTSLRGFHSRAFTLVELLVVIGIIAMLMGILFPVLGNVRSQSRSLKCKSNLRQIGLGLVMYADDNHGCIIPSYNLPSLPGAKENVTGGPQQPLDGWPAILDRDGYVPGQQNANMTFYCPETVNIEGMRNGQTGTSLYLPRGWTDWPMVFTSTGGDSEPKQATTIPAQGFYKIIRCSYWINAYNPVGSAVANLPANDLYYTCSVGFGPDNKGNYLRAHNMNSIACASLLIVAADGVYMGRQSVDQLGQDNCRIGYRHSDQGIANSCANACFADGHVEAIPGNVFPDAVSGSDSSAVVNQIKAANLSGPTVYANPQTVQW